MKFKDFKLGATKRFPRGKIHDSDEGELRLAVSHHEGNVVVNFGTPVTWIGLPPEQAIALAQGLMEHAHQAQGGRTQ